VSDVVLDWVLRNSPTKRTERVVLVVLARHANRAGVARPAHSTIAHQARCSRTAAQTALRVLEEMNAIRRIGLAARGVVIWQVLTGPADIPGQLRLGTDPEPADLLTRVSTSRVVESEQVPANTGEQVPANTGEHEVGVNDRTSTSSSPYPFKIENGRRPRPARGRSRSPETRPVVVECPGIGDALAAMWAPIGTALRSAVNDDTWGLYLEAVHPHELTTASVVLGASEQTADWIADRYGTLLQRAAAAVVGPGVAVRVVACDRALAVIE